MYPTCHCNNDQCTFNNVILPEARPDPIDDSKVIKVDFGEVQTGHVKTTRVSILNTTKMNKTFIVEKNAKNVTIYQFFKTTVQTFAIPHRETYKLKITYKPLIVWSNDCDFFNLVDSTGVAIRVEVSGKSIGPRMQISVNNLRFNTWPQRQSCKKAVEIRNLSAFPVEFKFDIDDTPMPIYEIVPHVGVIGGGRHVIVIITFRATTFGEYSQRFFCMIHNHRPLMVDCFGVYWKTEAQLAGKRYIRQSEMIQNTYDRYMQDVQLSMKEKPAFSFIDMYMNFGTLDCMEKNESMLVTSMTNHREQIIIVKWCPDEYFKVTPDEVMIPANESVLFECSFRPAGVDHIYSRHLMLNVFYTEDDPDEDNAMPIPGVLRVLGHSFSEANIWIPQFEAVPRSAILPPVLPGCTSFTTMELRSTGHLPTSFKFISPTASNFLVKPMLGTVQGKTIVVIQLMTSKSSKAKLFTEEWHCLLNNDKKHQVPICLKGYAEYPSVEIGQNNSITIKGVQVGCEKVVSVTIRNTCQLEVYYEFITSNLPNEVKIFSSKGTLAANATDSIKISFKSPERMCKQFPVGCLVYAMKEMQVYGSASEIAVTMNLEADQSFLCCMPSSFDFGTVECHSNHWSEFCLFNYGHTTIHYELSVCWSNIMELYQYATVTPVHGTLEPKAHVHCCINFGPHATGLHCAHVYYKLRPDVDSFETIANTRKCIYLFKAKVIYPYFQIIEIADHNFGPLFSKRSLWECLNINWLNYALAEARHNDSTMCIDLNLPDAEMNNKHFYVKLMAQNVTQFPVHVSLKRRKLCDCQQQEVGAFLSIRRRVYQCPHRLMCKLSIMEETISPLSVQDMTLQVNYICEGETKLSYHLSVNGNRSILLNFKVNAIGIDEAWLSKYSSGYSLLFQPIGLCEKQPKLHAFWFYNNTNIPVRYQLSMDEFEKSNKIYQFQVWHCPNPTGFINEYEAHPLFIQYRPLERKSVMLHVPLTTNDGRMIELNIRGRGSRGIIPNKIPKVYFPEILCADVPVHMSMDRLRMEAIPIWSSTTRMIFITNMSDDILGYNWFKSDVPGLCLAEVIDPSRVLRPNQTDVLIVQVKSFDKACLTRVHLPCQIISHTKYLQHQKSLKDHRRREQEIQDEFIITDSGVSFPKNEIEILPKAGVFYVTLALDIEITSFIDRDSQFTPQEQLQQAPQQILSTKIDTLPHKQNLPSISFLSRPIHPPPSTSSTSTYNDDLYVEKNPYEIDPSSDNVEFYRQVTEALLADAIFSNNFRAILNVQKRSAPIFYTQIKPQRDEPSNIEKHIENMYKEPQMPFVKDLMHEMLLKSMDSIFDFKPEVRSGIDYRQEVDLPNTCKCRTFKANNTIEK